MLFVFFFFFFAYCVVLFFKSVLKSILGIISAAEFRKKKTNTEVQLVSIAAVFGLVTQPLRDERKNDWEGDLFA